MPRARSPGLVLAGGGAVVVWVGTALEPEAWAPGCLLGWTLLALAVIDARTGRLPDALTLPLLAVGLGVAALFEGEVVDALSGAAIGYGCFAGLALAYRHGRGRDGLGLGDAKLLAAAGAWVGVGGLPSVVLLAAVAALAVALAMSMSGRRGLEAEIAFGPYLAAGVWLVWLYGPLTFS